MQTTAWIEVTKHLPAGPRGTDRKAYQSFCRMSPHADYTELVALMSPYTSLTNTPQVTVEYDVLESRNCAVHHGLLTRYLEM